VQFPVDGTVTDLPVRLLWPGSDMDLALIAPVGRRPTSGDPGIESVTGSTYEMLKLASPEPGF